MLDWCLQLSIKRYAQMQPIVLINQRVQNAVVYIAAGSMAMLIVALIIVMANDNIKPIMDNVLRRYDFFIFIKASVDSGYQAAY